MGEILVKVEADTDLSLEAEKELNEKAALAARIAGFNSVRAFEIAAKEALVKVFYPQSPKNGKK